MNSEFQWYGLYRRQRRLQSLLKRHSGDGRLSSPSAAVPRVELAAAIRRTK